MSAPNRNTHRRYNVSRRTATPGPQPTPDLDPPTPAVWGRRRKSRSPSQRNATGQRNDAPGPVKRKKSGPLSSASAVLASETDVTVVDHGRRVKSKPPTDPIARLNASTENVVASGSTNQRSGHTLVKKEKEKLKLKEKEKEKEYSRLLDSTHHSLRCRTPSEPTPPDKKVGSQDGNHSEYSGPLAAAEFKRMQKEIDTLRKVVHDNKKAMKKQNKTLEDLQEELNMRTKTLTDKDAQLQKLKSKSKKIDELVNNIETSMQCQICMELLLKPFALPPCGHVLCLGCLQEWFRKAPADEDDMVDDNGSDFLLYRRKTCPCCRSVVSDRPIPVFVLKTIATAFAKAKNLPLSRSRSTRASSPPDDDPWAGLFPSAEDGTYDEDEDRDDDEDEDDEDEDVGWGMDLFAYGSGSDEEPFEGEYVLARWEPPSINGYLDVFPFDSTDIRLLRRGVTVEMIANYQIEYTHEEGLSVVVEDIDGNHRVFLGWNIKLSSDDMNGEGYLEWVMGDITSRPERWEVTHVEGGDGAWEARKLVPYDEVVDYDTTDSENWIDDDDID